MRATRTIGVVTVGRSDFGIYLPVLRRLQAEPNFQLHLIVAGMHWLPRYGLTANEITKEGFVVGERVEFPLEDDSAVGIACTMGAAVTAFAKGYARRRPDILLVLGDRFEMHAAALAALPLNIPVAHIHGGELTLGAIDNALRHSITHLAHYHFVAAEEFAARIRQFGEEPWRVVVAGAPALDLLQTYRRMQPAELETQYGITLADPPILVTYHPVTLEYEQTEWQFGQVLRALEATGLPLVFTAPNADTCNRTIHQMITAFLREHPRATLVPNFGPEGYFNMMQVSRCMVGNSSSGIIEAASFELPVVNVGTRQEGRLRARNVIDVGYEAAAITEGIRQATAPAFRAQLRGIQNPYGDGHAAERIVKALRDLPFNEALLRKRFVDDVR